MKGVLFLYSTRRKNRKDLLIKKELCIRTQHMIQTFSSERVFGTIAHSFITTLIKVGMAITDRNKEAFLESLPQILCQFEKLSHFT